MRLNTAIAGALLMGLIGVTQAACSGAKLDPTPYQFIENRDDP